MIPRHILKIYMDRQIQASAFFSSDFDFGIDQICGTFMLDTAFDNRVDKTYEEEPSWHNLDCYM